MEQLHKLQRILYAWAPRLVALTWGAYAATTALAYLDARPGQLEIPASILPGDLWTAWALAAILLVLGAIVPSSRTNTELSVARWFRVAGMAIIAALLAMWTDSFFGASDRGWVSGKNYLMLLVTCVAFTVIAGRERGLYEH